MTVAQRFFIFLCATMTFNCKADYQLPEPTDVIYRWDDQFHVTVSWSWKMPDNLPEDCTVKYEVVRYGESVEPTFRSLVNNFIEKYFTEDKHSDHWNISIQAVLDPECSHWKKSRPVIKTIKTSKRRTELVTDFRCSLESDRTKCFWKPVNESVKLNISYRTSDKHDKIRACDGSTGHEKNVCYLNVNNLDFGIYVLVETETGCNTLKPKFVIPLPKMNITEDQGNLHLTWERSGPAVGNCGLNYSVWITECNNVRTLHTIKRHLNIPYNKNCQYKFQYSVKTNQYCIFLFSDLSEVVTHGENRSPDEMLIVIAIVVPIILSVCVILSCYCFQRNREILCPRIPDPSTIFKEMMMTGSRDSKPIPGNLYTPVPEPTEHITLVSENTVPQENS